MCESYTYAMRTNIDLDDDLMRQAMRAHHDEWNNIFLFSYPTIVVGAPKVRGLNAESLPFWLPDTLYRTE